MSVIKRRMKIKIRRVIPTTSNKHGATTVKVIFSEDLESKPREIISQEMLTIQHQSQ
jgi:hypothetical protein